MRRRAVVMVVMMVVTRRRLVVMVVVVTRRPVRPAGLHPEHLVLGVSTLRTVGVDGHLDVVALLRMRCTRERELVRSTGIQASLTAPTAGIIFTDEHR